MKKADDHPGTDTESGEMLSEHDLAGSKGVRGKYYQAYRRAYAVKVYRDKEHDNATK